MYYLSAHSLGVSDSGQKSHQYLQDYTEKTAPSVLFLWEVGGKSIIKDTVLRGMFGSMSLTDGLNGKLSLPLPLVS